MRALYCHCQISTREYMEEVLRDMAGTTQAVKNRNQVRELINVLVQAQGGLGNGFNGDNEVVSVVSAGRRGRRGNSKLVQ